MNGGTAAKATACCREAALKTGMVVWRERWRCEREQGRRIGQQQGSGAQERRQLRRRAEKAEEELQRVKKEKATGAEAVAERQL